MTKRLQRIFAVAATAFMALAVPTHPTTGNSVVDYLQAPAGKTIRGEIKLIPPGTAFEKADVIVSVEDVSVKDVPVKRLAQRTFKDVSYDGRPDSVIKFTIDGLRPEPKNQYQVRVLIDLDHSGRISKGDYRSTRPTPVFTAKDTDPLIIKAELKKE